MRTIEHDVIVVGEDESACFAAIAAAEEGCSVGLLLPFSHVGGISSGTLASTDIGKPKLALAGLYGRLVRNCGTPYGVDRSYKASLWEFEKQYGLMLRRSGVRIYCNALIKDVEKSGKSIKRIVSHDGVSFVAKVCYIDGGRFGDLMTRALPRQGWTIGRESREAYNEVLAGWQSNAIVCGNRPIKSSIDGRRYEFVSQNPGLPVGSEAPGVQPPSYRAYLTNNPRVRGSWGLFRTKNYDRRRYEAMKYFHSPLHKWICGGVELGKVNINDVIYLHDEDGVPLHFTYPLASYSRRKEIEKLYEEYQKGKLYFFATDVQWRGLYQDAMQDFGPPLDEMVENGGWPRTLYMREGVRMIGEYVTCQSDTQDNPTKHDSIAVAGYSLDIKASQIVEIPGNTTGYILEGSSNRARYHVAANGWGISWRSLIPQKKHCDNLIVPYCASVTHIAWGSYRIITSNAPAGEAAGVAASLMKARRLMSVHQLDAKEIRASLKRRGCIVDPPSLPDGAVSAEVKHNASKIGLSNVAINVV